MKKLLVLLSAILFAQAAWSINLTCPHMSKLDNSSVGCTHVQPCFNIGSSKYCNANGGTYFYDEDSESFWMAFSALSPLKGKVPYISNIQYAHYNPQTKAIVKDDYEPYSVHQTHLRIIEAAKRGDKSGLIKINTIKTVEQMKAGK